MAEIAHVYADELTLQTHTGDLTYTTKFTVAGSNFVASAKYLLIVMAQVGGNNASGRFKFRVQIDGVTPTGGEYIMEPANATAGRYQPFIYGTVWTTPGSAGDVTFQIAPQQNTSHTARADTIQLFAMRIDADLTENTDWLWNEDTTNSVHSSSAGWDDRASITFTPGSAGDDWLVLAFGEYEVDSISLNAVYRINYDSGTAGAPLFSQEGEDFEEQIVWMLSRVYNLSAASHTFTVNSQDDATGTNNHNRSGIFAINLAKFETSGWDWNEAEKTLAASNTFEEILDLAVTPATAGNWLVLGTAVVDMNVLGVGSYIRCQLAGTVVPTGKDVNRDAFSNDATDENFVQLLSYLPSLSASLQDIDIDGRLDNATNSRIEDRSFVAFSLELAAGGPAAYSITGASTVTLTIASTMAAAIAFNIIGDVTITPAVASTMDYNLNASIAGASDVTASVLADMIYNLNASIVGDVTVNQTIASGMVYEQAGAEEVLPNSDFNPNWNWGF